jgi:hypothetical protein
MHFKIAILYILSFSSVLYCCTLNNSFSLNSNQLLNFIGNELENIAKNEKNIVYLNSVILQTNETFAGRMQQLETSLADLIASLKYFRITGYIYLIIQYRFNFHI